MCVSILEWNFKKKIYMRKLGKKCRFLLKHQICNYLTNKKYSSADFFPSRLKILQLIEFLKSIKCLVNHFTQCSNKTVACCL